MALLRGRVLTLLLVDAAAFGGEMLSLIRALWIVSLRSRDCRRISV
jgi:hypothetical protein